MVRFYLQYYVRKITREMYQDEDGAALVEYALLVALIALACVLAITNLGQAINDVFEAIVDALQGVAPA